MSVLVERPTIVETECSGCGETVLEVRMRAGGLAVVLDRAEVLREWKCPTCRSARLRDYSITCWRCGDSGVVGEPIEGLGAAVGEDDLARPVDLSRVALEPGESLHRAHRCVPGS